MADNVWNAQLGRWEDPSTGNYLAGGQGNPDGTWSGGVWTNPQGGQLVNGGWIGPGTSQPPSPTTTGFAAQNQANQAAQGVINANSGVTAAQQANIPNQYAAINANRGVNTAQAGVLGATAATFPIQQQQIAANGQVIAAQQAGTVAQQGFIGQQQQANAAQQGDQAAIVAARNNTADQIAVAQYNQSQADMSGRYTNAGVAQPARVITADNRGGPLAPGVIGDVQTQEQRVTTSATDRENQRQLTLQGAQLAVNLINTNTDLAREAAAKVGLNLDEAKLVVQQAENNKGYAELNANNAQLNVQQGALAVTSAQVAASQAQNTYNQAELNLKETQQPPFAGAVASTDPVTGLASWVTPQVAAQQKAAQNLAAQQAANVAQMKASGQLGGLTQSQLLAMLNDSGTGSWLGPKDVQNELVRRYNAGETGGLNQSAAILLVQSYMESHGIGASGSGGAGAPSSFTSGPNAYDAFDTPAVQAQKKAARIAAGSNESPSTPPSTPPSSATVAKPGVQQNYNATAAAIASATTGEEGILAAGNGGTISSSSAKPAAPAPSPAPSSSPAKPLTPAEQAAMNTTLDYMAPTPWKRPGS